MPSLDGRNNPLRVGLSSTAITRSSGISLPKTRKLTTDHAFRHCSYIGLAKTRYCNVGCNATQPEQLFRYEIQCSRVET